MTAVMEAFYFRKSASVENLEPNFSPLIHPTIFTGIEGSECQLPPSKQASHLWKIFFNSWQSSCFEITGLFLQILFFHFPQICGLFT
jgi:hypothetical protein